MIIMQSHVSLGRALSIMTVLIMAGASIAICHVSRNNDCVDHGWLPLQSVLSPETNQPPVAQTAGEITVVLPADGITLDGRNSTDDKHVVGYRWTQTGYVFTASKHLFTASSRHVFTSSKHVHYQQTCVHHLQTLAPPALAIKHSTFLTFC